MTREEIIAKWNPLKDRERDMLIAMAVYEWSDGVLEDYQRQVAEFGEGRTVLDTHMTEDDGLHTGWMSYPTTDDNATCDVLRRIATKLRYANDDEKWCRTTISHNPGRFYVGILTTHRHISVSADTLGRAVCLAALIAVLAKPVQP